MPDDISSRDGAPVPMPPLPPMLRITTEQQLKAVADPMRSRILVMMQHEPLTAKQVADRLQAVPGTISHHIQVLEAAGLIQVVATRQIHGITAKWYARTARIFVFDVPPDVAGTMAIEVEFLTEARAELIEALGRQDDDAPMISGFPHMRLSLERAQHYQARLEAMVADLLREPLDPSGQVYGLVFSFFLAPDALQPDPSRSADDPQPEKT